jgi:hypothetical protein
MKMPRIYNVKKSRKDQGACSKCGDPLPAGTPYRWIKPRYGRKRVRCTKHECRFRASDLTSSDKLSRFYAAQEIVEDHTNFILVRLRSPEHMDWTADNTAIIQALSGLKEDLESMEGEYDDVSYEYEDGADNIEMYFSETEQSDRMRECAYQLQDYSGQASDFQSQVEELIEELTEKEEIDVEKIDAVVQEIQDNVAGFYLD